MLHRARDYSKLSTETPNRQPYLECFCCPPNVVRTIAQLSGWAYSLSDNGLAVNLYGGNKLKTRLLDGSEIQLRQDSHYPWDGRVEITIESCKTAPFEMLLRIPDWGEGSTLQVNGQDAGGAATPGSFTKIERPWKTGDVYDFLGITDTNHLSAASRRAIERGYDRGPEWYCEFTEHDLKGDFAPDAAVIRRDPSAVITVAGKHYVYYTKSTGVTRGFGTGDSEAKVFPWDKSEIWFATSTDGWEWKEQDRVVERGHAGAFDDRSVFTPEVLVHGGRYVLLYQTVKSPYTNRVKNQVGMAIADLPAGPFCKLDHPLLSPADNGQWLGDEDNRFFVRKQGDFDSHKVHDPTLMFFRNKFYLYYKGERMGERKTLGGREIRWGVAVADQLEGPYVKSEFNPITNSGHEIIVWPWQNGIAAMLLTDGPERNTIQWSPDGINFEIMSHLKGGPEAAGLVRELATEKNPLDALSWGLTHQYASRDCQYIRRFHAFKPVSPSVGIGRWRWPWRMLTHVNARNREMRILVNL